MYVNGKVVYITGGLVFLALMGMLVVFIFVFTPAPAPAPAARPAPAPEETPAVPPVPPETSPRIAPATTDEKKPAAQPARQTTGTDLTGTWALLVDTEDGDSDEWERYVIEKRDGGFMGHFRGGRHACEVALDGMRVRIVQSHEGGWQCVFAGILKPSLTEAIGTYETLLPGKEQDDREIWAARIVRLTDRFLKEEERAGELAEKRLANAQGLYEAIKRFADRNGGKLPIALSQLTPEDLPDRSLMATQPGRRVEYAAGEELAREQRIAEIGRAFRENEWSTESLAEYERQLAEVWGGSVPVQSQILRIVYDNPVMTLAVTVSGVRRLGDADDDAQQAEPSVDEQRNAEFNNLKQLMLVCKMFANENKGHQPGGWLMVYPEYLGNPEILRSPWAPEGASSYTMLFPGETEADLEKFAAKLIQSGVLPGPYPPEFDPASPTWRNMLQNGIPTIVAADLLPANPDQPPARAVAFLDGHIEAVPLTEWDARIAPFVAR